MGFFKRLRAGSSAGDAESSSSQAALPHARSRNGTTSPGPSTHYPSPHHTPNSQNHASSPTSSMFPSPRMSSDMLARPSMVTASSSSSIVNKIGKVPWRRKGKEKDIGGPSYEEVTPSRPSLGDPAELRRQWDGAKASAESPAMQYDSRRIGGSGNNGAGKRDTMVFIGPGPPPVASTPRSVSYAGSPNSTWGRSDTASLAGMDALDTTPKKDKGKMRQEKSSLGVGEQEGGFLGKLGFEERARSRENSWIDVGASPPSSPKKATSEKEVMRDTFETPGQRGGEKYVSVWQEEPRSEKLGSGPDSAGRVSDEIEVLESAEKKQKFWKGIRHRRASRAASDAEDEEPGSPTPRKSTMPQPMTELAQSPSANASADIVQSRPQQIRRPSSSLFHNPFTRSMSRTSFHDIEVPVAAADDKSFQLKSFRHISGTSDVEGPGQLEGFLSHVPRGSMVALDEPKRLPTPDPPTPTNPPPTSYTPGPRPRAPSRNQLSRPPSVATSLASMDDMVTTNRISAAAFRKGIRRPSEVFANAASGDVDDDDDDLPLGMITKHKIRDQSALSLSSMRDTPAKEKEDPVAAISTPAPPVVVAPGAGPSETRGQSRSATPSPKPSPTPSQGQSGKSTSGFVVKGRPSYSGQSPDSTKMAVSPARSASHSPLPSATKLPVPPSRVPRPIDTSAAIIDQSEVVDSPPPLSASQSQPFLSHIGRQTSETLAKPMSRDDTDKENHVAGQPAGTVSANAGRPLPSAKASLPPLEDSSLSLRNLPLPPDQMPDTPPKSQDDLSQSTTAPTSPTRTRKISMLEEPLRVISGFWGTTNEEDKEGKRESKESFDQDLVLSSMAAYGEPEPAGKPEVPKLATTALAPPADATSPVDGRVRSPIEIRLANAAAARAASARPSLNKTASASSLQEPSTSASTSWMPQDISINSLSKLIDSDEDDRSSAATSPVRVPTTPVVAEDAKSDRSPEIESSFARARPIQPRSSSAKLNGGKSASQNGSIPTLSTLIDEERRRDSTLQMPAEPARPRSVSLNDTAKPEAESSPDAGSSFARAPRMTHRASTSQLAPAAESNDSDSDDEPTQRQSNGKGKGSFGRGRQHPAGPRKTSTKTQARALSTIIKDESSSSSEDESLSVLRAKASMSSLNLQRTLSPGNHSPEVSTSPGRPAKSPLNPGAASPQNGRTKCRTESTSSARPVVMPRKSSRAGMSVSASPKPATKNMPDLNTRRSHSALGARLSSFEVNAKAKGSSGSPESSSQSATSGSMTQAPVTPRDGIVALQQQQNRTSVVEPSQAQTQWRPEARDRRHSQLPLQEQHTGYPYNPQMSMQPPGADQAAMLTMMKQAWQAQFMAAAYKASEDEWERASAVSGHTSAPAPPQFPPFAPMGGMGQMAYGYPSPMGQMPGWPGMPGMPGMGMPGMGMPGMPMPGMGQMGQMGQMPWMPHYGAAPSGQSLVSQHTGGGLGGGSMYGGGPGGGGSMYGGGGGGGGASSMYGYGTGTQSVYGGEFGPPQHHQQQHQQRSTMYSYPSQMHLDTTSSSYAPSHSHSRASASAYDTASGSTSGPPTPPRPAFAKHGRTGSSGSTGGGGGVGQGQQPPTAWRQSGWAGYGSGQGGGSIGGGGNGVDGQWDDAPTPRKNRVSGLQGGQGGQGMIN